MPAIRTEGKRSPVPSYYRPQNIHNASGAAARRHVASDYPNNIEPLDSDATDNSNIKPQVRIEIGEPQRRNFMDILVGGDVVTVDKNVKGHDTRCSGCQNGGPMILCEACPRAFCKVCIRLTPKQEEYQFVCPACHFYAENNVRPYVDKDGEIIRYFGKVSTRESFMMCDMTPVAIIVITLEGMDCIDPMRAVYHHFRSHLFGNVAFIHFDFNLVTAEGIRSYAARIDALLAFFKPSEAEKNLSRFRKIAVCIMTNSTEEGMLHVGPNNEGCGTIAEVFEVLFPPSFRSLIQQSINSALFLVACGSAVTLNDPLKELRNIYEETKFKQILTFSQDQFQVAYATYFLQDYMLQYYVYNRSKVEAILTQHQSLGAHSDIILFRERAEGEAHLCERLVWAHPGIKPVGIPAPLQCEACGSIRPWQVKGKPNGNKSENFVIHQCKWAGCRSRTGPGIQYNLPESMKWVKEPVAKNDSRGGWVLEKVFEVVAVHDH